VIEYAIVSCTVQSEVSYNLFTQLVDTGKGIVNAVLFGLIVLVTNEYFVFDNKCFQLFMMLIFNIAAVVLVNEVFKNNEYKFIKEKWLQGLWRRKIVK
jgi:hypothetical protein